MKELITTQLIEEYRLQLDFAESQYKLQSLNNAQDPTLKNTLDCLKRFIHSLQSKQSEERQNIVDAYDTAKSRLFSSSVVAFHVGEDYFNQTFKQEQIKHCHICGGENEHTEDCTSYVYGIQPFKPI